MKADRGLALLLTLIALAVMAVAASHTLRMGSTMDRRDAEEELLHLGQVWRTAIQSYVSSTPGQAAVGPAELADLLRDPRFPGVVRHLRSIPVDPLTLRASWGVERAAGGQIVGIYSLAEGEPIRQQGFEPGLEYLAGARRYRDWVFSLWPPAAPAASRPLR